MARSAEPPQVEANRVIEIPLLSETVYEKPFVDVEVDAIVTQPDGSQLRVPAFWAGGNRWCFRYASPTPGEVSWRTECTDTSNPKLHGAQGKLQVVPNSGENPLYRHGPIRVADDGRHFAHADGTPFLWLADTWWKNLCKRMTCQGFQQLTADRRAKGFSVVQIVCGPYPDEGFFEARWENEGGKPYASKDFAEANPAYFEYADRRLKHLIDAGIVPAIVGAWGRADCNSMQAIGPEGLKRHWRHLVARYGAYPVVWILAGEIGMEAKWGEGPWAEVAEYLRRVDPYHRPLTCHTSHGRRGAPGDKVLIDFDMVGGSHNATWAIAKETLAVLTDARNKTPPMPVLCGETVYEGHMQQGFQDAQRHVFWMYMLNGAAGHTYGAAGVWHASVEGDPGITPIYDWTTWRTGMNYPGSAQLGLNKKLLEAYPWWRFEPHPEWAESDCFAAGIAGQVRLIYQPRRSVYNWAGAVVKGLEQDVPYHAFYFDPASGHRFDLGTVINVGPPPPPFDGHAEPRLFEDRFEQGDASPWRDYGSASQRKDGRLLGTKGMVTIAEKVLGADLMASADANSDAEAGIILRFRDPDNYVVALYSPSLKAIFLHDRKDGQWGPALGRVAVPEIGPKIHLAAAACDKHAAMVLSDGQRTYCTPTVPIDNKTAGKAGVWLYQVGERQEFDNFEISRAQFAPGSRDTNAQATPGDGQNDKVVRIRTDQYKAPALPSPQDWVLVLERAEP
jgi:hypothetical protein